jgi:hypothetical protein
MTLQTYIVALKPDLPLAVQQHVEPWALKVAFKVQAETRDAARFVVSLNASMAGPRLNGEFVEDPWCSDRWSTCAPIENDNVEPLFKGVEHIDVVESRDVDGSLARIVLRQ